MILTVLQCVCVCISAFARVFLRISPFVCASLSLVLPVYTYVCVCAHASKRPYLSVPIHVHVKRAAVRECPVR